MTKWKFAIGVVWIILASPYVLLNVWGIRVGELAEEVIAGFSAEGGTAGDDTDAPNSALITTRIPANFDRVTIPNGHAGVWARPGIPSLFSSDAFLEGKKVEDRFSEYDLTSDRRITFHETIALGDLLREGEAKPDPEYARLFMMARAPGHAMDYCAEMLSVMATRCALAKTTVSEPRQDDVFGVSFSIGYAPAYDMGDVSLSDTSTLISTPLVSLAPDAETENLLPNAPDTRRAYFEQAMRVCAQIKATFGNCVVDVLTLQHKTLSPDRLDDLPPGTERTRLSGSVSVSVYAPDAPDLEAAVQRELERAIARL